MSAIAKLLKDNALFSGLSDEQLQRIIEAGEQREIAEGELVFKEGDEGCELFVLLDGRVQITIEMSLATEQVPVHTVIPGKVFGEFALIACHERSASARTLKGSSFFVLSQEAFLKLAEADPKLGYVVQKELSQILVGRLIKTTRELRASLMF